jgi:prophage regulatory protein
MRLLTFEQLRSDRGIAYSRDHLRRKCGRREFPAPVQLSENRIGWVESEVDAWLEQRAATSRWRQPAGAQAPLPPPAEVGDLPPTPRAQAHNAAREKGAPPFKHGALPPAPNSPVD